MSYSARVFAKATPGRAPYVLAVLAALALLLLAGCVNTGAARADAELYEAMNLGHAADASLSADAKRVAQINADLWAVQAHTLGGSRPSDEALARLGDIAAIGS